ncbi:hypothetical protein LEMLEM_LOCUS2974 [Lemmus lemmus]
MWGAWLLLHTQVTT